MCPVDRTGKVVFTFFVIQWLLVLSVGFECGAAQRAAQAHSHSGISQHSAGGAGTGAPNRLRRSGARQREAP